MLLFCSSEFPVRTKRWSCSNSLTELTLRLTTSLSRHLSSRETQANHSKKAHNPIQSCGQEIRCRAWLGEQQEPADIMGPCKSTKFSLGKHQMHQTATRAQQLTWPASHDRVMIPWKLPQGWKAWKLLLLISEWSTDGVSEKLSNLGLLKCFLQLDWPPRNCLNGIWQCDPCPCFFAHLIEKVQPNEVGTLTCPGLLYLPLFFPLLTFVLVLSFLIAERWPAARLRPFWPGPYISANNKQPKENIGNIVESETRNIGKLNGSLDSNHYITLGTSINHITKNMWTWKEWAIHFSDGQR